MWIPGFIRRKIKWLDRRKETRRKNREVKYSAGKTAVWHLGSDGGTDMRSGQDRRKKP